MPTYNKLVRDKIPAIIRQSGKTHSSRVLDYQEYMDALKGKFREEWREYAEATSDNHAIEELADLLEILYCLAQVHGASPSELNDVCDKKRGERGGFSDRVFLIEVLDE